MRHIRNLPISSPVIAKGKQATTTQNTIVNKIAEISASQAMTGSLSVPIAARNSNTQR
jgi:hypothetical protein